MARSIWDDKLIGDRSHDLKDDPEDVTAMLNADHALRANMLENGLVKYWSITKQYRLTEKGKQVRQQRIEAVRLAKEQGLTHIRNGSGDDA